jgi:hypothetical protein
MLVVRVFDLVCDWLRIGCGLSFVVRLVGRLGWGGGAMGIGVLSLSLGCSGSFIRIRIIVGVGHAGCLCCCLPLTINNNYLSINLTYCCSIIRMILAMSLLQFDNIYEVFLLLFLFYYFINSNF